MRSIPWCSGADLAGGTESKTSRFLFVVALVLVTLVPREARAMHLADGALPASWCALWTLLALPIVIFAWRRFDLRRLRDERLFALVAMMGAAVFAVSCMPVPIPIVGSCSHPCGTGLAAIVVGPLITVSITTVALVIQALFLAHGGLTTLGADVLSMGVAGGFVGFAVYRLARRYGLGVMGAAFLAGLLSDWATYATTAFELAVGLHGQRSAGALFGALCLAFAPTQLPLGLLEGWVTAGALVFLERRRSVLFATIDRPAAERA